jgi:hypothetical protein
MEILFQNHLSNNFINPIYKIHSFNVLREYPVNLALFFFLQMLRDDAQVCLVYWIYQYK